MAMRWPLNLYRIFVVSSVTLYAVAGLLGARCGSPERDRIDPSVRSSPGGYQSFHFWHTGFAGGK